MERDQDKFYEDEELDTREAPQNQQTDEVNDMRYFLELLKHIRAAINAGTNVPLTGKKIIDAEKCLMIIDDMEKNLPDAVQYGLQMYSEQEPDESLAEELTDSYGVIHPQPVLRSYNAAYEPRPILPGARFEVVGRVL